MAESTRPIFWVAPQFVWQVQTISGPWWARSPICCPWRYPPLLGIYLASRALPPLPDRSILSLRKNLWPVFLQLGMSTGTCQIIQVFSTLCVSRSPFESLLKDAVLFLYRCALFVIYYISIITEKLIMFPRGGSVAKWLVRLFLTVKVCDSNLVGGVRVLQP